MITGPPEKYTPWSWAASATLNSVLCARFPRTDAHKSSRHTAFHWNHKLPESSSHGIQVQWHHSQSNFQHVKLEFVEIQVNSVKAFLLKSSSYLQTTNPRNATLQTNKSNWHLPETRKRCLQLCPSSHFIPKWSFKMQNFKTIQKTLGNATKLFSSSKSVQQIYPSEFKSHDKAYTTTPTTIFPSRFQD